MRLMASFLRYTGYHNFVKDHINLGLLLILVCTTTELSISSTSCLSAIGNKVIKIPKKFIRGMLKI